MDPYSGDNLRPASYSTQARAIIWLWLVGLRDAICLHRCAVFFVYDNAILSKVLKCFVLNGVIFLGSTLMLENVVDPAASWMLHAALAGSASDGFVLGAISVLRAVYTWLWLVPAYAISFLVNCLWYQEIAEMAFKVLQSRAVLSGSQQTRKVLVASPQPWNLQIGQEVHRVVLFNVFLLQVLAVRHVPYIGPLLYFFLYSWLYAFYWHDYKWSLTNSPVRSRLDLFESHWAFFAGFGSICIIPQWFFSFLHSEAIMGMLFPLFVLIACDTDPRRQSKAVVSWAAEHGEALILPQLPIFKVADAASSMLITKHHAIVASVQSLGRIADHVMAYFRQTSRQRQRQKGKQAL